MFCSVERTLGTPLAIILDRKVAKNPENPFPRNRGFLFNGDLAQLVERQIEVLGVRGSNPLFTTTLQAMDKQRNRVLFAPPLG